MHDDSLREFLGDRAWMVDAHKGGMRRIAFLREAGQPVPSRVLSRVKWLGEQLQKEEQAVNEAAADWHDHEAYVRAHWSRA